MNNERLMYCPECRRTFFLSPEFSVIGIIVRDPPLAGTNGPPAESEIRLEGMMCPRCSKHVGHGAGYYDSGHGREMENEQYVDRCKRIILKEVPKQDR